jgi:hypothetical protein
LGLAYFVLGVLGLVPSPALRGKVRKGDDAITEQPPPYPSPEDGEGDRQSNPSSWPGAPPSITLTCRRWEAVREERSEG